MNTCIPSNGSVHKSIIRCASSAATALLLGAALLPATASAYDGTVTLTGTIYESPCDFSDNSVTCYSGAQRQTLDALIEKIKSALVAANNAADKFQANTLISRYRTMCARWDKHLRGIENGTIVRPKNRE